jgi:acyl carrier protein
MKVDRQQIKQATRNYILSEFLPGEKPESLSDSMELISNGILDSLATLKLVAFLESTYRITLEPHEAGIEYLNTIDDVVNLVMTKLNHR